MPFGFRLPRTLVLAVMFLLGAAGMYVVGYDAIFSSFSYWDDEGGDLIELNSFISNGSLYSSVYAVYGPFYYQALGALFSLINVPITHDAGRFVTLSFWITSSTIIGFSVYRLTRNIAIAIAVQLLVFGGLRTLVQEPMWPGGLIALLLSGALLVATSARQGALVVMALLGAIIACLMLTKINVGVFALAAFLLTAAQVYQVFAQRKWLKVSIESGFVLTPLLLMVPKIQEIWVQRYAIHVCVAATALVWVMRSHRTTAYRPNRELVYFGGALFATIVFICAYSIGTGTSLSALYEGTISQPLLNSSRFIVPFPIRRSVLAFDAVAIFAAWRYAHLRNIRTQENLPASGASVFLATVFLAIGFTTIALGGLTIWRGGLILPQVYGFNLSTLSFCWMVLVHENPADQVSVFVRRFVPALAVVQALHAYPVAGNQTGLSCFLLIVVGAILISDATIGLRRALGNDGLFPLGATCAVTGLTVLLAVGIFVNQYESARGSFDSGIPLGLKGSARIRLPPAQATLYRGISEAINENCKSFIMLPGMNSFYLWTGQDPPSHFNVSYWTALFGDRLQEQLVHRFEKIDGLCLLRNNTIEEFWTQGKVPNHGPLLAFVGNGFQPIAVFGDYELLRRETSTEWSGAAWRRP